ncbi:uncharacterized protein LOC143737013 [Siphateles boraxobius]|uniref:uncharacterized protein LOC143737013 n=1 Tax=Siphateles boraxobius TaxID=180520 RepID=UPI00406438B6
MVRESPPLAVGRSLLLPSAEQGEEQKAGDSRPWTLSAALRWSELPVGRSSSLPAAWVLEGRLPSGRERSRRRWSWAGACCRPPAKGSSRERGTPAICPRHPRSRRRPPGGGGASFRTEGYPASPPGTAEEIPQLVGDQIAARCGNRTNCSPPSPPSPPHL